MQDEAVRIDRARNGCAVSFRALMEHHGPPVHRLLVRLTGGRTHDAEDLYQEALLKVASGIRKYQDRGTFRAWFFRIARNAFLDEQRRRKLELSPLHDGLFEHRDPSRQMQLAGLERDLQGAVDQLTPKLREVFLMRFYGQLSFKEIAHVLEIPKGTVLARMTYAMRAVRPRLEAWRLNRAGGKA